jgi:hypothetical protein
MALRGRAIDVAGRTPILVYEIRPVGNQAADSHEEPFEVDCVHRGLIVTLAARHRLPDRRRAPRHDEAAIRSACECGNGALDLACIARPLGSTPSQTTAPPRSGGLRG